MALEVSGRGPGARARHALRALGGLCLAGGVALVLFLVSELWLTGLVESHHQGALRARLAAELPPAPLRAHPRDPGAVLVAPVVAPPPEGQPLAFLVIPSIGVDQVVVEGVAAADLALGPGHYPGTPLPGEAGNAGVAGHRTTYGHPFWSLDALRPGQDVIVTTRQGRFVYAVARSLVVDPADGAVLDAGPRPELTLTTCTPRFSAAQRLVVQAVLVRSSLFGAPRGPVTVRRRATPSPAGTPRVPRRPPGSLPR